jgi:6-methylsalicylate decarboxylase
MSFKSKENPMSLIDVHAHFVTDDYLAAALAAGCTNPDGMPGWPAWSLQEQLDDMDRREIDKAVLSISSPGVHFGNDGAAADLARAVNDEAASYAKQHPDRLTFFASLPLPDVDAAIREARRASKVLGAPGVALESHSSGGQYLGDPSLEPLWTELEQRNTAVFIHPTSPVGWEQSALGRPRPMVEFMFDTTRTITDLVLNGVLERHPGLRVIVPHSGAALALFSDRIAFFDPTNTRWRNAMKQLWFDMAGTPFPIAIPALAQVASEDHLLYGSDSCWTPAPAIDAQIQSIDVAAPPARAKSWRSLTTENAHTFFGQGK